MYLLRLRIKGQRILRPGAGGGGGCVYIEINCVFAERKMK